MHQDVIAHHLFAVVTHKYFVGNGIRAYLQLYQRVGLGGVYQCGAVTTAIDRTANPSVVRSLTGYTD